MSKKRYTIVSEGGRRNILSTFKWTFKVMILLFSIENGKNASINNFSLNTLHNSKRLGPFLGFGFNFCGKQDEYLKTDKFGQTSYTLFNSNNK